MVIWYLNLWSDLNRRVQAPQRSFSKKGTHFLKKITPTHTKDWYIKWVASFFIISALLLTSNYIYPLNLVLHGIGLTGWLAVSIMWNDRSLMILNSVGLAMILNALLKYTIEHAPSSYVESLNIG